MSVFITGQRWISESEPELGLGTVVQAGKSRVQVVFKAAGETRTYAVDQAPLKRVRFRVGDTIRTQADQEFIDHIRPQEIKMAQAQQQELGAALLQSRLRLDALRLIWKGPPEALK
jgi:hypothetical protein